MAVQLATVDELTAWAGPVDPALAGLVLDGVSATAIRLAVGASAGWLSPDTVPPEVKGIILQVACRVVTNPSGLGGETVAGYTWTASRAAVGVTFTGDERQGLLEAAGLAFEAAADTLSVPLRPGRCGWRF